MKYLSLFSGIGGFELGIQYAVQDIFHTEKQQYETENTVCDERGLDTNRKARLGNIECIGFSEIDKYAAQIYQSHFPNHKNYGDITRIEEQSLPNFDLLCGGFPCQSFSIAGKRLGFSDTRGTMFFHIARILKAKKPKFLLLENVKGLLSHDNGRTFKTIIATLDELGYDLQWQVLNSKNHGVPQNRERVFIVGHLRGTRRPEVFPFAGTNTKDPSTIIRLNEENIQQDRNQSNDIDGDGGASYTKIRRLTPTECERLQGFPDGWTEGVSDTQRYKCLGNAVTVNVIKDIMLRLI